MGGMFSDAGVLDPTILQKGISTIKEQMKDVQREALMIETEMEKRFSDMINKKRGPQNKVHDCEKCVHLVRRSLGVLAT